MLASDPSRLASDLSCALDPVAYSEAGAIAPDPWQARLLRSRAQRILINASRQSGKSTTVATLAMHTAVYHPRSLILLLSPAQRQSGELFKKCLEINRGQAVPSAPEAETALTLHLANGSRIVSLPGKEGTIRGFSGARLIVIDEAARVNNSLYLSVRPMLAVSGGRLAALSTPWGTRGWWYDAWRSDSDWERYEVPATDCPRIAPAFLAEEEREMGEFFFRQEYMCEFLDAQTQAFRREDIDRAFTEEVEPWEL